MSNCHGQGYWDCKERDYCKVKSSCLTHWTKNKVRGKLKQNDNEKM